MQLATPQGWNRTLRWMRVGCPIAAAVAFCLAIIAIETGVALTHAQWMIFKPWRE